tara:strand:- start:518 stop:832 length:315 start_codon:yes stop_codon:yes gene_type:complete
MRVISYAPHNPGSQRVRYNIAGYLNETFLISDRMIVESSLPERPGLPPCLSKIASGLRLDPLYHSRQVVFLAKLEKPMDVIGHNDKCTGAGKTQTVAVLHGLDG